MAPEWQQQGYPIRVAEDGWITGCLGLLGCGEGVGVKYTFIILFKYVDFAYVYLTDKSVHIRQNYVWCILVKYTPNTHQIHTK